MHRLNDVAVLAVSCMLVFMSFSTLQGLNSSILDPSVAFVSLGTLYVSFAFFNMFAAAMVVELLGCRISLVLSSLTYTFFALANIAALYQEQDTAMQTAILLPFSILTGLGASVLWAAQGVYITRCALKEHVGRYTGTFFGIFWFAQIFGPLLTSTLLQAEIEKILVFKILAGVGFMGSLLLVYLWVFRPEPSNPYAPVEVAEVADAQQPAKPKFLRTFNIMFTRSMILLIPLYYSTSIEQAFSGGSLPLFIKTDDAKRDLSMKLYLQATFGTTLMISSFVVGGITDRFGSRPLVLFDLAMHVGAMAVLWIVKPLNNYAVLFPCAIVLAMSDSLLMNQIYKLLGTLYPNKVDTPTAFAGYKFHQSLCTGLMFVGSKNLLDESGIPIMRIWTLVVGGMLALAMGGVFWATAAIDPQRVEETPVDENTPLLGEEQEPASLSAPQLEQAAIQQLRLNNRLSDVLVMALSFFFIFSAFMVIQGLATSVLPKNVAFRVLGTLYFSFAFCNLFLAAPIVDWIGCRAGLFLASLSYSGFNLATIVALRTSDESAQMVLLIPAAIVNGLGASVLWSSESVYITKCACKDTMGRYSGYFYAFVSCANLAGPIFSSVLFTLKFEKIQVFQILFIVGLMGPLLAVYLLSRPPPSNPYDMAVPTAHLSSSPVAEESALMGEEQVDDDEQPAAPVSAENPLFKTFNYMISPTILSLAPISYFGSCQMAFNGGSIPLFINTGDPTNDLTMKLYVVATMGAVSTLSSACVGPLTDSLGPRRMLPIAVAIYVVTIAGVWYLNPYNRLFVLFPSVILFSVVSSITSNQGYKIMGVLFAGNASAFAAQRFHGSLVTGVAFVTSGWLLGADGVPDLRLWAPLLVSVLLVGWMGALRVTSGERFVGVGR
ncbi:DUF895 domain membrane protein [Chytriomyces hyalinus]|nr:DUF895 domain membrane protein [Chytriomyces hyalinus]